MKTKAHGTGKPGWVGYGVVVVLLHVVGISFLMTAIPHHPSLLGLALLAYTFGLRHAFDADHIAAIDNTVRKLRQQRRSAIGVGFYFSLGHSTVVCVMAVVTAFAVEWAQRHIPQLQTVGGIVGTLVSSSFLILIGLLNCAILINISRLFKEMRQSRISEEKMEKLLQSRGLITRFVSPLFRLVNRDYHIYPIGFLFGLGFDTASEIALLAISAGAAKNSLPVTGVLSLPLLFASAMSLMDTADGVFMSSAYNWALATPVRKMYYNLTVTGLSVVSALVIGLVEALQILMPQFGASQGFFGWLDNLDLGNLGFVIVSLFVLSWGLSYGIWKFFRIEQRWSSPE
ncbi:HoxN/HupN/NixA family nickel/cobalt transporter [Alicyclobacillus fastidiosus]|uniref:Nickel/cobalt efflux system n=1 Tax=Alicyclobacillus fastidiosus TaxID=392011 RepID=A0ABY6ZDB5_9BACL|nr:HoxN/HupN/NixA family nickel/cobalt transporter [Alicyclobacillus fastidiosus]WAH40115.1 HoxN/HupN/NixA family nickel/cobalt transporter [Alicyclobacillus fastidiosus]GMA61447.1 HoxN/HupN/NixA family nickel/cobalt transporter [Alicyclobacillus fastidiosus]